MSKTIETIHSILSNKFRAIATAITPDMSSVRRDYDAVYNRWRCQSTRYLADYGEAKTDTQRDTATRAYENWVIRENFVGKLDALYGVISQRRELEYPQQTLEYKTEKIDFRVCAECGSKMTIYPHTSEMRCNADSCGYVMVLKGTMFDDTQCYTSDGTGVMPKRGRHETNRHCRAHLDRILALKSVAITPRQREKIERWISENVSHKPSMTCATFRRCLKDVKETKLNEHIPYVRQQIIGISPDGLTDSEQRLVHILFDKTVAAIGTIGNMKYYPFFILKILEIVLHKPEDSRRLRSIIDCIHFQRDDTVAQNDQIWYQAWLRVPEFNVMPFRKTDRNLLQKF